MVEIYFRLVNQWFKEEVEPRLEALKQREKVTLRDFRSWYDRWPPITYKWVTNAPIKEAIRFGSMWLPAFDSNGSPMKDWVAVYHRVDDSLYRHRQ